MTGDAREIAVALYARAQRLIDGSYLTRCPVPEHGRGRGDFNPSLHISDGENGWPLLYCNAGCNPRDVLDALRRRELLDERSSPRFGDRDKPPAHEPRNDERERRQHEKAAWLWSQRKSIIGSIAERYLREARGITCALPATLAFLPPLKREHHPAMIAAFGLLDDEPEPGVVGAQKDVGSVHLTLLRGDGSGKAAVEPGKPDKLIIGSPTIKIDDDVHGLPIVLAPPNDLMGLAITEGIEDALTAHAALGVGAWAAGSAGMMPKLAEMVPSYIEAVTIFAHADKTGADNAPKLAAALRKRGIEVMVEGL